MSFIIAMAPVFLILGVVIATVLIVIAVEISAFRRDLSFLAASIDNWIGEADESQTQSHYR